MAFTELHFHLLPGLDDGPRTLDESVELAAMAVAEGTTTVVATTHINRVHRVVPTQLPEIAAELRARLTDEGVELDVLVGGEIAHNVVGRLSQVELETIAQGPQGRRWVMLEAPLDGLSEGFSEAADELRERGFGVLVAHPERALAAGGGYGWRYIESEISAGSAFQVNAWSLTGDLGPDIAEQAVRVLDAAPRAVVASDAHGPHRPPALRDALFTLRQQGDVDAVRRCDVFPAMLLRHGLAVRSAVAV